MDKLEMPHPDIPTVIMRSVPLYLLEDYLDCVKFAPVILKGYF